MRKVPAKQILIAVSLALLCAACAGEGERCTYFAVRMDTCDLRTTCVPGTTVVTWESGTCVRVCKTNTDCPAGEFCATGVTPGPGPDVCWH